MVAITKKSLFQTTVIKFYRACACWKKRNKDKSKESKKFRQERKLEKAILFLSVRIKYQFLL